MHRVGTNRSERRLKRGKYLNHLLGRVQGTVEPMSKDRAFEYFLRNKNTSSGYDSVHNKYHFTLKSNAFDDPEFVEKFTVQFDYFITTCQFHPSVLHVWGGINKEEVLKKSKILSHSQRAVMVQPMLLGICLVYVLLPAVDLFICNYKNWAIKLGVAPQYGDLAAEVLKVRDYSNNYFCFDISKLETSQKRYMLSAFLDFMSLLDKRVLKYRSAILGAFDSFIIVMPDGRLVYTDEYFMPSGVFFTIALNCFLTYWVWFEYCRRYQISYVNLILGDDNSGATDRPVSLPHFQRFTALYGLHSTGFTTHRFSEFEWCGKKFIPHVFFGCYDSLLPVSSRPQKLIARLVYFLPDDYCEQQQVYFSILSELYGLPFYYNQVLEWGDAYGYERPNPRLFEKLYCPVRFESRCLNADCSRFKNGIYGSSTFIGFTVYLPFANKMRKSQTNVRKFRKSEHKVKQRGAHIEKLEKRLHRVESKHSRPRLQHHGVDIGKTEDAMAKNGLGFIEGLYDPWSAEGVHFPEPQPIASVTAKLEQTIQPNVNQSSTDNIYRAGVLISPNLRHNFTYLAGITTTSDSNLLWNAWTNNTHYADMTSTALAYRNTSLGIEVRNAGAFINSGMVLYMAQFPVDDQDTASVATIFDQLAASDYIEMMDDNHLGKDGELQIVWQPLTFQEMVSEEVGGSEPTPTGVAWRSVDRTFLADNLIFLFWRGTTTAPTDVPIIRLTYNIEYIPLATKTQLFDLKKVVGSQDKTAAANAAVQDTAKSKGLWETISDGIMSAGSNLFDDILDVGKQFVTDGIGDFLGGFLFMSNAKKHHEAVARLSKLNKQLKNPLYFKLFVEHIRKIAPETPSQLSFAHFSHVKKEGRVKYPSTILNPFNNGCGLPLEFMIGYGFATGDVSHDHVLSNLAYELDKIAGGFEGRGFLTVVPTESAPGVVTTLHPTLVDSYAEVNFTGAPALGPVLNAFETGNPVSTFECLFPRDCREVDGDVFSLFDDHKDPIRFNLKKPNPYGGGLATARGRRFAIYEAMYCVPADGLPGTSESKVTQPKYIREGSLIVFGLSDEGRAQSFYVRFGCLNVQTAKQSDPLGDLRKSIAEVMDTVNAHVVL